MEKIKHILASFRIIPTISTSPTGDSFDVSFNPKFVNSSTLLEDAFSLLQKVTEPENKLIVVLDEFPELLEIEKNVDKRLRAIMQEQTGINYIFLGSQESMMTDIFERMKSPFFHFGQLMRLGRIPHDDFKKYITERLSDISKSPEELAENIFSFTNCHPYYTQQLAARCWEIISLNGEEDNIVEKAIEDLVQVHDLDYERIWLTFTKVNRKIMQLLSTESPIYQEKNLPPSTSYSAVKKLMKEGYVIKNDQYELEDPFFRRWIKKNQ